MLVGYMAMEGSIGVTVCTGVWELGGDSQAMTLPYSCV